MSTKITYNGKTTELADGYIATLPCKDYKMETDVVVEAPELVEVVLQEKTVIENGEVTPDEGYDGLSKVTVNVPSEEPNLISKTITENGTYKASEEVDDDSIIGTWYLNKVLTSETMENASIANTLNYNGNFQAFKSGTDGLYTYDQFDYMNNNSDADRLFYHQWNDWVDILVYQNGEWVSEEYRTIVIDKEPSSSSQIEPMLNWLKVNATKIIVDGYSEVIVNVEATDSPLPTEVATEAEMTALLSSGTVGGVYKYTGTTGTYENGALYVLEAGVIKISLEVNSSDEGVFNFPVPSGATTWSDMNGVVDETSQYVITTIDLHDAGIPKICRAGDISAYFYGLVRNNINTDLVQVSDTLDYDNTYYSFVNTYSTGGGGSN